MKNIITLDFNDNIIACLAGFLKENLLKGGNDLTSCAVVFGGKRPALFLKKELSGILKSGFFPPVSFSMDEFMEYAVNKKSRYAQASDLDTSFMIYNIAKKCVPGIISGREDFVRFMPWALEIASFIDELDLERIDDSRLFNVEDIAEIGFEIPDNINEMLKNIVTIRKEYHKELKKKNIYSRGLKYLEASKNASKTSFDEFEKVIFCNPFYLHETEAGVIKSLMESGKGVLFFQKDDSRWKAFEKTENALGIKLDVKKGTKFSYGLNIHKGFDSHSQAALAGEILKNEKSPEKVVIVLSESGSIMPVLWEIPENIAEFNVSAGYSLKKSSLYDLVALIFKAQVTRKESEYYTGDYLKVLLHPFIKNMDMGKGAVVTRIIVHKIEEILLGIEETALAKSTFFELTRIETDEKLLNIIIEQLRHMGQKEKPGEITGVIRKLHNIAFGIWEAVDSFSGLAASMEEILSGVLNRSFKKNVPLNLKAAEKLYSISDEFKRSGFNKMIFPKEDIFKVFESRLDGAVISFAGSPLRGLQILGLFETRALNFETVIVMDANESVLPSLRLNEPLIPRQIMISLGLNRLEQEEEIQRYHFTRLISSAKNVHLIYDDSFGKERSRFIEELIWKKEKEKKKQQEFMRREARFRVDVLEKREGINKNPKVISYLKDFCFSPSSADTYVNCPLQFYYQYVLGLEEKEELCDEPQGNEIGIFIHDLLEDGYRRFVGKSMVINDSFRKSFNDLFEKRFRDRMEARMGPDAFMVKDVLKYRLERFLDNEEGRDVREIICLEKGHFGDTISFPSGNVRFKYRIDRVDRLEDGYILVIDYKTGMMPRPPADLKKLEEMSFDRISIKDTIHSFQLPIYYSFVKSKYSDLKINAALYNIREPGKFVYFIKQKNIETADRTLEICMKALEAIILEIRDPCRQFESDTDSQSCRYCPFSGLCG